MKLMEEQKKIQKKIQTLKVRNCSFIKVWVGNSDSDM